MTSVSQAGPTSARVAKLATQTDVLQRGESGLIGLFGPSTDLSALVRAADGRIRRVENGDRLGNGRIIAIDENGLMVEHNGRTWRLRMPPG